MQRRTASAIAFVVLIVIAMSRVSAFSGMPPRPIPPQAKAATSAGAVEACKLFKKEDAAAALGGTVTGPKETGPLTTAPGTTVTTCEYAGPGSLSITLYVTHLSGAQLSTDRAACAKDAREGLAGLGDVACWYDEKHEELHVFKGLILISIELSGKNNPTDAIKAAAKKVVDRMK